MYKKYSKLIQIIAYLVIWAVTVSVFWLGGKSDAMGYSLVSMYFILPVSTLIISILIGKDKGWTKNKWFMILFFGVMYTLAYHATFNLANMIAFNKVNIPDISSDIRSVLHGMIASAIGMSIGSIIKYIHTKRAL